MACPCSMKSNMLGGKRSKRANHTMRNKKSSKKTRRVSRN